MPAPSWKLALEILGRYLSMKLSSCLFPAQIALRCPTLWFHVPIGVGCCIAAKNARTPHGNAAIPWSALAADPGRRHPRQCRPCEISWISPPLQRIYFLWERKPLPPSYSLPESIFEQTMVSRTSHSPYHRPMPRGNACCAPFLPSI